MSKAFTKDDDAETELLVVPRAPLPDGVPNYVTPRGIRLLRDELASLERERATLHGQSASDVQRRLNALAQRAAELQARIASAVLVGPHDQPHSDVRFGASIRVRHESGRDATYRIVGVDEADAAAGLVAFCSPLARAVLAKRRGEIIELCTPRSSEELELLEVRYPDDTPE